MLPWQPNQQTRGKGIVFVDGKTQRDEQTHAHTDKHATFTEINNNNNTKIPMWNRT